jgi:soluble lytic murein transglycosylase-like protein
MAQAADEIGPLADAAASPWQRYRIARSMAEAGQVRLAVRAAEPLLDGASDPPPSLLTLVYPARYLSQANAAASEENVSPFLLLALVRQESLFDAGAVSSAGALGLTRSSRRRAESPTIWRDGLSRRRPAEAGR